MEILPLPLPVGEHSTAQPSIQLPIIVGFSLDWGRTSRKTYPLPSNGYILTAKKTPLPLLLYLQRRCIETEVIGLLPEYSLSRECVYRVVAQQRLYMSQYIY
jgi:hypothetical protein